MDDDKRFCRVKYKSVDLKVISLISKQFLDSVSGWPLAHTVDLKQCKAAAYIRISLPCSTNKRDRERRQDAAHATGTDTRTK